MTADAQTHESVPTPDPTADAASADQADAVTDAPAGLDVPVDAPVEPESTEPEADAEPQTDPEPTEPEAAGAEADAQPWGRVDADGTVSVREGETWRVVGEYPDGTVEEALAYFERKYTDLAGEVTLLEVRHRRAGAASSGLRSTAESLRGKVEGAAAVGDLRALDARLVALIGELTVATAAESAAAREAVEQAIAERTAIVERAEALAARDPRSVQWKQTTAEMSELFDQWQTQQQHGARLPKSVSQQLWKRFRDARATVDKQRREFYAELDGVHKAARDRKTHLVERAEALAPKGEDGIGAYRELLDQWKSAGRAGKKADDALWARFKAAGDALYGARGEREAAEAEASREKIEAKRELLEEARSIPDEKDTARARTLLTAIQRRWDDIGRIFPRDKERALDDELRKIEQSVRGREDLDWKRNNPETKARANDMTRQLTDAISKLEAELADAERAGDERAAREAREALEARRGWLRALGG